jgi:hypothetical protein
MGSSGEHFKAFQVVFQNHPINPPPPPYYFSIKNVSVSIFEKDCLMEWLQMKSGRAGRSAAFDKCEICGQHFNITPRYAEVTNIYIFEGNLFMLYVQRTVHVYVGSGVVVVMSFSSSIWLLSFSSSNPRIFSSFSFSERASFQLGSQSCDDIDHCKKYVHHFMLVCCVAHHHFDSSHIMVEFNKLD